jgi:3'(2'), 5'-bisphosphate nucleotidase
MLIHDTEMPKRLVEAAGEAGRAVLEVYEADFEVEYKTDRSPLTEADRRSHEIITERLSDLAPNIPVLSEEGRDIPYEERFKWKSFFLVDPLDGTKEFIDRNGDFTVNIALIEEDHPVLGVVHVPVEGVTYYAASGLGAFRQANGEEPCSINVRQAAEGLAVVSSRSHPSPELKGFLKRLDVRERVSRGSSLKFCLVAEGGADIYPRLGPTWEWDTAAGHCVVEEAGGMVTDLKGGPLRYNKESLKHEGFIAFGGMSPAAIFG